MNLEIKPKQQTIFVSLHQVVELLTLSESTIRRLELRDNSFPRRRQISSRRVGWALNEIQEWAETRLNVK
jgi:predicted DNA-binding transcriptional regulator AlpA